MDILNNSDLVSNEAFIIVCLTLAVVRVYLEVIGFDFNALPLTKSLGKTGYFSGKKFHKMGLYVSIGYIVLFAPSIIFGPFPS